MIDDSELRARATTQHGLVTLEQMALLGFGERQRRRLVDGRRWERLSRNVISLVGAPDSDGRKAMAAVLDAGAAAALRGTSAAAWWGIPGNALHPLSVARVRGSAQHDVIAGRVHDPCHLPPEHVVVLDHVPVVTPARALFDIAGARRRGAEHEPWIDRMARMVDTAWSMRLVSGASLHDMLDDMAQRGRPGIRVMRQVLETRGRDYVPPASGLESRVAQLLERAGERPLRRQVDTGDSSGWIGRVDFRDEIEPYILEVQSERFHSSQVDRQIDAARIARLEAAGFVVDEVTDEDVWLRPDTVVETVRRGRRRAAELRQQH